MNSFIHRTLRHFMQAEEGAPAATGAAPATSEPAAAPAGSEPSVLDQLNNQQTVGELEAADKAKNEPETAEAKAAREAADNTVPEAYAPYKLQDGFEIPAENLEKVNATFKELGLTQSQAQKLIDLQSSLQGEQTSAQADAMKAAFEKQTNDWAAAAKADPELGGDKFDATVATAQKAMTQFGTPELRAYLNQSGNGNHPELIRLLHKVGTAISEDKVVISGSDATESTPQTQAQAMFGNVKFD